MHYLFVVVLCPENIFVKNRTVSHFCLLMNKKTQIKWFDMKWNGKDEKLAHFRLPVYNVEGSHTHAHTNSNCIPFVWIHAIIGITPNETRTNGTPNLARILFSQCSFDQSQCNLELLHSLPFRKCSMFDLYCNLYHIKIFCLVDIE